MSLILDALKRLEQEKAVRKDGKVNIAAEIVQTEHPQPRRKRMLLLAVAVLGVGLAAVATLPLRTENGVSKTSPPAIHSFPPAESAAMPAPVSSAQPLQKPEELPLTRLPANIVNIETPPPASSRPRPADAAANRAADMPVNPSEGTVLRTRVAGIVWHEERGARRAYVNGSIAAEGSVIDGARIVEIYPDRIRFSRGGKSFDVSIEKTP